MRANFIVHLVIHLKGIFTAAHYIVIPTHACVESAWIAMTKSGQLMGRCAGTGAPGGRMAWKQRVQEVVLPFARRANRQSRPRMSRCQR